MTVPVGTILGWSAAPGEAGGWGLADRTLSSAVSDTGDDACLVAIRTP